MLWCILFCGWYDRIKMKYWRSFIEIKAAGDWQKRKSIISACARLSLHTGDLITHLTTTTTTDNSPNPQPLVLLSHKVYQGNAAIWPFFMFFCEEKNKYFLLKDWKYSFQALLYTLYSTLLTCGHQTLPHCYFPLSAESPVRPIDNWQDSQPSSSIEPVNGISLDLIRCLVSGPDQESGIRMTASWSVTLMRSRFGLSAMSSANQKIIFRLCSSICATPAHCIDINMHQYDTARVKCIAGLWEHVQWTFLAREKLFWSVI